jgi:predicted GTPase
LDKHDCTIEEREEYEPYIDRGMVIYAGVDYEKILKQAEQEADIIIWDGGNNDFPFYKSNLHIVVADPHRAGHEMAYYPGEANVRMADVVVINKEKSALPEDIETVKKNVKELNPEAMIMDAASPIIVEDPDAIRGKRVLVVEDGPTLTHGEMRYGAGYLAAKQVGAGDIIDPRPFAVGSIKNTFDKYDHLENILPAMGYGDDQVKELEQTINQAEADVVVSGTPIDLRRVLNSTKPIVRVKYDLEEIGKPDMEEVLQTFIDTHVKKGE